MDTISTAAAELRRQYIHPGNHAESDYFSLVRKLVEQRNRHERHDPNFRAWQDEIDQVYELIQEEIESNPGPPLTPVKFGTSGWRGIIGKDFYLKSVQQVTEAIITMYRRCGQTPELLEALGLSSLEEAQRRGCVIGHDNRFGGRLLAERISDILTDHGFKVFFADEATTGTMSAAVLELGAAFSINLTPSHNPLEYAGFKFNAADGGPAAPILTNMIARNCDELQQTQQPPLPQPNASLRQACNALETWQNMVRRGKNRHGLDYDDIMARFAGSANLVVAVDSVHGASRVHIQALFQKPSAHLLQLRGDADVTFDGIAPEPSSSNMQPAIRLLQSRKEPLKLGFVIDPDADRIRFTDGSVEITMNQFGPMAYHYLHEIKGKNGMVAKSVATSNFANCLAKAFGEEVFEPKVGFKEFKPVIEQALVCFEESDGITVIGHTPEKDAYIGLLLALDMVLSRQQNLGDYLAEIQQKYGNFFPAKDGVTVSRKGEELINLLEGLKKYVPGSTLRVGGTNKRIQRVLDIDGYKMIFEDESWIMIRPSGTEPKVRFYVEARSMKEQQELFDSARALLQEIGLL